MQGRLSPKFSNLSPKRYRLTYMASIEERKNKFGKVTSYRVVWRDNGQKMAKTLGSRDKAEQWKGVLEVAQHDTERAKRALLSKISQAPKFSEIVDLHIRRLTDVTEYTRHKYQRMYDNHLEDRFGSLPVDQVTEDDIAEWVAHMIQIERAPKTINNVHSLIHAVMHTAVKRKLRPDNPCTETRLPRNRRTRSHISFLTHDEFRLLLDEIDLHHQPFVLFLVGTGLRFSEAAALSQEDFSDERGEYSVRVEKAWKQHPSGKRYIGEPKTERARRTVGLHRDLAEEVAPLVAVASEDEPVFKMINGGNLTSQAFMTRVWAPAVDRARKRGLRKRPRIHDLRHTYASWMLAEGESLSNVSWLMGHESESTTRNVYQHFMPSMVRAGAEKSGAAMDGIMSGRQAMAELEY